jgi:hypothetical protein
MRTAIKGLVDTVGELHATQGVTKRIHSHAAGRRCSSEGQTDPAGSADQRQHDKSAQNKLVAANVQLRVPVSMSLA